MAEAVKRIERVLHAARDFGMGGPEGEALKRAVGKKLEALNALPALLSTWERGKGGRDPLPSLEGADLLRGALLASILIAPFRTDGAPWMEAMGFGDVPLQGLRDFGLDEVSAKRSMDLAWIVSRLAPVYATGAEEKDGADRLAGGFNKTRRVPT